MPVKLKMISNLSCPVLATDGFSMAHYKEGRMATERDELTEWNGHSATMLCFTYALVVFVSMLCLP